LTKEGNSEIGGGFYDDHLWLIISTAAYLKETGDYSILDEEIGYADLANSNATLLDHLEKSIEFTLENRGPNGLPLIGHADWNDCMNLNCFSDDPDENFQLAESERDGKIAESLMIAGLFCRSCMEMEEIYSALEMNTKAAEVKETGKKMQETIYEKGWDGNWFLRAYDANGNKVGSKENEEGQIYIESQGWCVYGGVGFDNGHAEKAMESVSQRLASPEGVILHQPAYQQYYLNLGEISSYPPGYKENAGIFTHNNTWIQIAEAMLGHGEKAMEYYKSICPPSKEDIIERYRAEPYVYSQFTAGPDAATSGEGKNSWLTGTAAWSFVALSQYILGIKPDHNGLLIDPCIPKDWNGYSVTRTFRGSRYKIDVENSDNISKGVKSIEVDGEQIEGNIIPVFEDEKEHKVKVIMG
jgi:cellobiose phosphorylase